MQACAAELWTELPATLREGLVRDGLDEPDIFVNLFVDGDSVADDLIGDYCDGRLDQDQQILARERLLLMKDVARAAAERASRRRASFSVVQANTAVTISSRKREAAGMLASFTAGVGALAPTVVPEPKG